MRSMATGFGFGPVRTLGGTEWRPEGSSCEGKDVREKQQMGSFCVASSCLTPANVPKVVRSEYMGWQIKKHDVCIY
ncbi:unnamed protein product [Ectocarpus sp. 13 AM-2016]